MAEWDPPDPRNNAELAQLMTAYQTGSMDAFETLYAALASPLLSYLASLCRDRTHAHDLLQEAFLQIHRSRRAYRPDLPVRPWAFTIARHVWLMEVRSRGRRPRPSEDLPDLPVPAEVEGLAARETLREAVPGTALSRRAIGLVLGTGIITTVTITFMTWFMSPTTIAPGLVGYVWIEDLGIEGLNCGLKIYRLKITCTLRRNLQSSNQQSAIQSSITQSPNIRSPASG